MLTTRLWRFGTATLAASALLMTTVGGATAQTEPIEELLDEPQLDELADLLGDDDSDEGDEDGLTGTPLDAILDELPVEDLEGLLDLLDGGLPGDDEDDDAGEGEFDGPQTGEDADALDAGEVPETGIGGFVGDAAATGLSIDVSLPGELRDGLAPVLEGLGVAGGDGIHIKVAETQAQLQRAADGEDVDGLAEALVTNLLAGSQTLDSPGSCVGGETVDLPPDAEIPLLSVSLAGIDCGQDDERAFADVQLTGVTISLAGLLEAGLPDDVRTGLDSAITPLNEMLLEQVNDNLTCGVLDEALGTLLPGSDACEALSLQLQNPLEADVPLVDVDLLGAASEVTADDDEVAADAEATLAGVNVLGLGCIGGDGTDPLTYSASVATDGEAASEPTTTSPSTQLQVCPQDENILNLVSDAAPLDLVELLGTDVQDLLDGALAEVFDGLEGLLDAIDTAILYNGQPYSNVEDAGAVAGVSPLTIVGSFPLADIPGLSDVAGELGVEVNAMEVEAGVNAVPAGVQQPAGPPSDPAPEPDADLPTTGASAAMLGLGTMGLALAMRRRDGDDE